MARSPKLMDEVLHSLVQVGAAKILESNGADPIEYIDRRSRSVQERLVGPAACRRNEEDGISAPRFMVSRRLALTISPSPRCDH
jgi:hypothetical protein